MAKRGRKIPDGFVSARKARNVKNKEMRRIEKEAADADRRVDEVLSMLSDSSNSSYCPKAGDIFLIEDDTASGVYRLESISGGRTLLYLFVHCGNPWIRTTYTQFSFWERFLGKAGEVKAKGIKLPKTYILLKEG